MSTPILRKSTTVLSVLRAWDNFWFAPRDSLVLAIIRIATGAMVAYIHTIWLLRIDDFFGPNALINNALSQRLHAFDFAWSYLWSIESRGLLVCHQLLAIWLGISVALGLFTRFAAPLAWFLTLMVCHRMTGFLFGLDQVAMMLLMYLSVSRCGSSLSVDSRIARRLVGGPSRNRFQWLFPDNEPHWSNQVSTRLMQIHLCIVYLFGGLAKLRGEMWWDGSAMWFSAVAYEYQSLDLTWIGRWPFLAALLTHTTVFWETFYPFLIWQRLWRPIMLGLAVAVHGGIALFLGMVTFGFMMVVANFAFVRPEELRSFIDWIRARMIQGSLHRSTLALLLSSGIFVSLGDIQAIAQSVPSNVELRNRLDCIESVFAKHHDGWSLDEVMLQDKLRAKIAEACSTACESIVSRDVWEGLMKLRKSGKLDARATRRGESSSEESLPIAEIAARQMADLHSVTFDQVLIDDELLKTFDQLARVIAPECDTYDVRKSALRLRKSRQLRPELVSRVTDWHREIKTSSIGDLKSQLDKIPSRPGIYIFRDATGYLYIGQSNNLRERLTKHLTESDRKGLAEYLIEQSISEITVELHIFGEGSPGEDATVREAYESDLIRTREPRLNLAS